MSGKTKTHFFDADIFEACVLNGHTAKKEAKRRGLTIGQVRKAIHRHRTRVPDAETAARAYRLMQNGGCPEELRAAAERHAAIVRGDHHGRVRVSKVAPNYIAITLGASVTNVADWQPGDVLLWRVEKGGIVLRLLPRGTTTPRLVGVDIKLVTVQSRDAKLPLVEEHQQRAAMAYRLRFVEHLPWQKIALALERSSSNVQKAAKRHACDHNLLWFSNRLTTAKQGLLSVCSYTDNDARRVILRRQLKQLGFVQNGYALWMLVSENTVRVYPEKPGTNTTER